MKIEKKYIPLILGMILIFIGSLMPSIKIAQENINFIKENGSLIIILVASMFILLKLNKITLISIPTTLSVAIIIKFINDNKERLQKITQQYNCYADFKSGLAIMLMGNIIIIITILITQLDLKKIKEKTKEKYKNSKKTITNKIEKINNKEKNKIKHETTKDGKIEYNKITIKCENKKEKNSTIKEKIKELILKLRLKKIRHKKLSITKYKEEKIQENIEKNNKQNNKKKIYYKPVINIKKWTRNDVCCINCGATVKTTSEYCFLCDCKIKIKEKEEKIIGQN